MESVKTLEALDCKFTIVAVGAIDETPEGSVPYGIAEFGTAEGMLNATATYSRDESLRVLAETLGLASGENKAMVFTEVKDVNATEWKLVKGLREGGYTRPQEIDHMIVKGPKVRFQDQMSQEEIWSPQYHYKRMRYFGIFSCCGKRYVYDGKKLTIHFCELSYFNRHTHRQLKTTRCVYHLPLHRMNGLP